MASDDEYEVHVRPAFVPFFWLFAGVGVVLFYFSLGYAKKYSTTAAFLLTVRLYKPLFSLLFLTPVLLAFCSRSSASASCSTMP
jgi:hypothetical protein